MKKINIPSRLRCLRTENKFTQTAVADFLKMKYPAYAAYEEGRSEPSIHTLLRLAELYGCSVNELLGLEKMPKQALIIQQYHSVSPEKRKIVDFILNT